MKKAWVFLCMAAVLSWGALAHAGQTVIENGLGDMLIKEIYLSRASTNDWEENMIQGDVLRPGESVTVTFDPGENECEWDLLAVDLEGNKVEWYDLDLCGVGKITLEEGGVATLEK